MAVDAVMTLLRAGDRLGAPAWAHAEDGVRMLVPSPASAMLIPGAAGWQLVLGDSLRSIDLGPFDRPEVVIHDASAALLSAGEQLIRVDRARAVAFVTGALFFAQSTANVLIEARASEILGRWLIAQGDIEQGFELISRVATPAYRRVDDDAHAGELGALVEDTSWRYDFDDAPPDSGAMLEQATAELLCAALLPLASGSHVLDFERSAEEGPVFTLRLGDVRHLARLVPHTYGWMLFTFGLSTGVRCRIVGLPGGDPEDVVKRTAMALAVLAKDDLAERRLEDAEVWARTAYRIARDVVATRELGRAGRVLAQVLVAAGQPDEADAYLRVADGVETGRSGDEAAGGLEASTA